MGKTSSEYFFRLEKTDYALIAEKRYEAAVASTTSTCRMVRPAPPPASAAPATTGRQRTTTE